ncbi:hypothetical protein D3C75_552230 [compost metagenome]
MNWATTVMARPSVPVGQMQWTTPGTYSWTVPFGVTTISFALVGAGQSGSVQYVDYQSLGYRGYGGMAGKYTFRNDVAVTPGQVITVVVGSGGTNGSGSAAVAGDGGGLSSFAGVTVPGPSGTMSYGPASGSKYGNDSGTGAIPNGTGINGTGAGVDLKTGLAVARVGLNGALCGGGGTGTRSGSSSSKTKGGDGGVRVIWGPGRAFPFTQTGDLS